MTTTSSLYRAFALASLLSTACGGAVSAARPVSPVEIEETRIVARRTEGGEVRVESYDPGQLFARAYQLDASGDCPGATALYDRLATEFPNSRYLSPALYNSGLCFQRGGQNEEAVERYRRLLDHSPELADAKHARLQMVEALVELERWPEVAQSTEALLDRTDLRSDERLEAMARRAEAALGVGELDRAERMARDALSYYRTRRGDEVIADEYFAACASFVLAETIRLRSESILLPEGADAATQHDLLDRRAQLLLDAQRAYFDTIRHTDARWAAAAGYRIGSMYERLYDVIASAPVPPSDLALDEAGQAIYRHEYRTRLRERVRPLMRHAIHYWELTLLMVERTGVRSPWVERTRQDLEATRQRLLGETTPPPEEPARGLTAPHSAASSSPAIMGRASRVPGPRILA